MTDSFQLENDWLHNSDISRLAKFIAHWKIYESIHDVPGDIVEIGVHKAGSLIRWLTYREMLDGAFSRIVVGFDTFGEFPDSEYDPDNEYKKKFVIEAGQALTRKEILKILSYKRININVQLIEGDVCKTVPIWAKRNVGRRIALLHIDVDTYLPTIVVLKNLAPLMAPGGKIILDNYGSFPGETSAWDEFNKERKWKLIKVPFHTNLAIGTLERFN